MSVHTSGARGSLTGVLARRRHAAPALAPPVPSDPGAPGAPPSATSAWSSSRWIAVRIPVLSQSILVAFFWMVLAAVFMASIFSSCTIASAIFSSAVAISAAPVRALAAMRQSAAA